MAQPGLGELARVEEAGLEASAEPRERRLDGWLLRFSPGKAKRARCVNAVATGRLPLAEKIALCDAAYAQAGLPMIVRITPFSQPPGLDAALAALGLRRFDDTRVMVLADLGALAAVPRAGPTPQALNGDDFAEAVGALRGSTPAQRQAHAERLRAAPVAWRGLAVRHGERVLACAQMALDGDLVGLFDVFTAPAARGQGLARTLCAALLHVAQAAGAQRAYLQVEGDNHAARALYHRLGFADAYAYHYRTRDAVAA